MRIIVAMFIFSISLSANYLYSEYSIMKEDAYYYYKNGDSREAYNIVNGFLKNYPKCDRTQKLLKEIQKVNKKNTKHIKVTSDVKYLIDFINSNPNDIINRKILASYYYSHGQKKKAKKLAMEILRIDPDRNDVIIYIKESKINSNISKIRKIAISKLEYFYKFNKFNKFINLYNALENSSVIMPTKINVKALYCALELRDFKRAESILYMYKMPKSKNIQNIKKLIERRVAIN